MQTYHTETTVSKERTLTLKELPFRAGDEVEVTVCRRERQRENRECYPLRGKPIRYTDPFGSIAEGDWDVLQ